MRWKIKEEKEKKHKPLALFG